MSRTGRQKLRNTADVVEVRMCVETPAARRSGVREPTRKMAAQPRRKWAQNQVLRIAFMEGSPKVRARVMELAREWEQHINLEFRFVSSGVTDIRIAFVPGASWSAIGKEAHERKFSNKATMNFGWLNDTTSDLECRRVVLHEFGHALGCVHEHSSPASPIRWNRSAAYKFFGGPPNFWSEPEVAANVFQKLSSSNTKHTAFDPESIMVYGIPASITLDGFSVDWNDKLSPLDIEFIRNWYPR